jgi:predicted transcriptional regulator of viral defense system
MDKIDQLKKIANLNNGIIRHADLAILHIEYNSIQRLINNGVLAKIKYGLYHFAQETGRLSEAAQVARLFPDGILSMYSALSYYQYSCRTPMVWDIAIDKNVSKSRFKLDFPAVRPHYLDPRHLEYGVALAKFEGCLMPVFDRDRLICECLKYETKMDREIFDMAMRFYSQDENRSMAKLINYSLKRGVLNKARKQFNLINDYD